MIRVQGKGSSVAPQVTVSLAGLSITIRIICALSFLLYCTSIVDCLKRVKGKFWDPDGNRTPDLLITSLWI